MKHDISISKPLLSEHIDNELADRIPYLRELGIRYVPKEGHDASQHVFHLPFLESIVGNTSLQAVHGGAVAGFMESAALLHLLFEHSDTRRLPKTIDFNIDYLRAAGPRDSFASCSVEKLGKRVVLVHIRCWQRHYDRPNALARAHYLWEELSQDHDLLEVSET